MGEFMEPVEYVPVEEFRSMPDYQKSSVYQDLLSRFLCLKRGKCEDCRGSGEVDLGRRSCPVCKGSGVTTESGGDI